MNFTRKVECTDIMVEQDVFDLYRDHAVSLANFEIGDNAELVSQLSQLGNSVEFQFIYVWGAPASGKSHLLQGLCAEFQVRGKRSVYIPLGMADLQPDMLIGLENLDLVCLDDLDRRVRAPDWSTAVFHLFNRLRERHACLVVAATCSPRHCETALADLSSRLGWGLAYQILPLPSGLMRDFLRRQANRRGIELSDSVLSYILSRYSRDMASLLSLLDQLDRRSLQQQRRITVPFLKQVLGSSDV